MLKFKRKGESFLKRQNVCATLIARTISVIANEGLDKTTTKAIVKGTEINEAYIYRFFEDKEDLLHKTFDSLDAELLEAGLKNIQVMYMAELDYEMRCRICFNKTWRFLLGNREKCLAYIRYYYSPYFVKYSSAEHKERFKPLVVKFQDAFRPEANVWMLLNHILNVMLDFSVKVYSGAVGDNEDTEEHVFRLVYYSINPYFKLKKEQE